MNSDLAQATALAASLDTRLGLGAHGPVWRGQAAGTGSEDPADISRVRARLEQAERRAGAILEANRAVLVSMAAALVEARELAGEELGRWLEQIARIPEVSTQAPGADECAEA
ncbi:hypothetical protein [Defluviimonas salinarum]|uniref:Uncharacterized protein n=1 Tax=Defluviimonas salinarum TaxID=2992147 RepID=A0ABT3J9Y1_9RHOB|nr:hypothetical protein [Defluviimonas salinarum]MCW3784209.1 hypothetical protein [Defluviimonas salinarum]